MKSIGKVFLPLFLALWSMANLQAQDKMVEISGTVFSSADGLPMIGAAAMEKGDPSNGTRISGT